MERDLGNSCCDFKNHCHVRSVVKLHTLSLEGQPGVCVVG